MYAKIPLNKIKKIAIIQTDCKKTMAQVKAEYGCQYIMNGGIYNFSTHKPYCKIRANGVTYADDGMGYWMYGWDEGKDIKMIHSDDMKNYLNGIACVAMIKDGKNTILNYNSDMGGARPRTAIGLDNSGNLVMYCNKANKMIEQTREIMRGYGCVSALNLDGGGSSQADFNGNKLTSSRRVANWICVWVEQSAKNPYTEPIGLVRQGNRGNTVRWVQWALNNKGYNCGKVDGIFGNGTKLAVMLVQKTNGLVADGIVGDKTKEVLR
mgnify:FL=1